MLGWCVAIRSHGDGIDDAGAKCRMINPNRDGEADEQQTISVLPAHFLATEPLFYLRIDVKKSSYFDFYFLLLCT